MADKYGTQFFRRVMAEQDAAAEPLDDTEPTALVPNQPQAVGTERIRRAIRINTEDLRADAAIAQVDPLLARLTLACWNRFFDCFRPDELAMEFPRYEQEATDVLEALERMGEHDTPDLKTCQRMLFLLSRFNKERFNELNARIDELATEGKDLQSKLDAQEIAYSVSADELQRCEEVLKHGVTEEAMLDEDEYDRQDNTPRPAARMIEALIKRMERDRDALTTLADQLPPEVLSKLPSETQIYLNFFRS